MSELLNKAQSKQLELFQKINQSPDIQSQRPVFHFSTPGGWCNDPNGFSQFNDRIHLFYQYHPYSTQWGPMHWGHATSTDFLEWQIEPVALAPDTQADLKGCFSGTAIEDKNHHILVYTGVSGDGDNYFQQQCIATGDGKTYTKFPENPVITAENIPFAFKITDFRDPKIWKKNDVYYMACVIKQMNNRGALILFESADLKKWDYKGILDYSKDELSYMWECPDVLTLDGKDLLILSPQEMKSDEQKGFHDGNNSVYISGFLDYEKCIFTRDTRIENGYTAAQIDYGIDFYAPETTKLKDGRTIMIGWMQAWESYITPQNYLWSGMMTIPRELHYKNNQLYQLPVRELETWKTDNKTGIVKNQHTETISENQPRHFELDLQLIAEYKGAFSVQIETSGNEKVQLEINTDKHFISFDRSSSMTPGTIPYRKANLGKGNINSIKILCDTCSLEVFIDEGRIAFTNTFFFTQALSNVKLTNNSPIEINYTFWNIEKKH